jgi:phosphatidylinositol alpha-1,6-mannosyltransferase
LVNLPIFIDLPSLPEKNMEEIAEVRKKYGIGPNEVFFVAASRLTYNKGYDLILEALRLQDQIHRKRMKILIVGQGPEKEKLKRLTNQYGLNGRVGFEDWLEPEAYERVIRAADVFLHPARFDAFGGGTLYAMALAVPVIGSDGAGSVLERVEHGISGLIYKAEDIQALADCMVRMIDQPQERICMGRKARETAEQWSPSRGAIIIKQALGVPLHLPEQ